MGDPKFSRRKYDTPSHPWQKERIDAENELIRKYGLKNKRELWKTQSLLRQFRQRSRVLQAQIRYGNPQAEKEKEQLLKRLQKMGILGEEASLDDVLGLEVEAVLTRRLQTLAYMKGLSTSQKQARQFIVHGHVSIGDRKVTIPGYLVMRKEEEFIDYLPRSPIADDMHPARPKDELDMATEPREEKKDDAPAEVPADKKPAEEKAADKKLAEEKVADEKSAIDKPAAEPKKEKPEAEPKEDKAEKPPKDKRPEKSSADKEPAEAPQDKPPKEKAKDEPAPEKEKPEEKPAGEPPVKDDKPSKAPKDKEPDASDTPEEPPPEEQAPEEKESKEEAKE